MIKKSLAAATALAVLCLLLAACSGERTTPSPSDNESGGISLKYAEHLLLTEGDGYTIATLADPWHEGRTLHRYILVPDSAHLPDSVWQSHLFRSATIVRTPLRRAVVPTSVHCGLLLNIGCGEQIAGVAGLQYIKLPYIQERVAQGLVADCGNGTSPTLETIVDINADAVIVSPVQNCNYGRLEQWGRPIIEAADYMETSALGRAEWMRFYGRLFGAEAAADSLFEVVETNYNSLKDKATASTVAVLMDKISSGGVWYVPGGQSTIGRLIVDAGARNPFADYDVSGSVPLAFESIFDRMGAVTGSKDKVVSKKKAASKDKAASKNSIADSGVWLIRYNADSDLTYATLAAEREGYERLAPYKARRVYGCNTRHSRFYEETPFRPDLLLRDLIIVTHPNDTTLGRLRYFAPLKQ